MGRGHSGLQGVGRTGESSMTRVEEDRWWDGEGRVGGVGRGQTLREGARGRVRVHHWQG